MIINLFELKETLEIIKEKMKTYNKYLTENKIQEQLIELNKKVENPDFWNNPDAKDIMQEHSSFSQKTQNWQEVQNKFSDINEILSKETDNETLLLLDEEINELKENVEKIYIEILFKEKDDKSNCFLTVHSGSGGLESEDWARMVFQMYEKYAKKFFKTELIDLQSTDTGGIKNATLKIKKDKKEFPFGWFKGETGVHRLVRISPYDKNKQRHTSFCSVMVLPEANENVDIIIDEKDLKIDTYKASGAGGQHVNKTESAIRITHTPTNIIVQCQNDRSQHKNKDEAMKMLKSKLYQKKIQELKEEKEKMSGEKKDISWGSQIRSYIQQPYQMVKDNRTGYEVPNFSKIVFDAEIEEFLTEFLKFNT